jgi:hypothetical protein
MKDTLVRDVMGDWITIQVPVYKKFCVPQYPIAAFFDSITCDTAFIFETVHIDTQIVSLQRDVFGNWEEFCKDTTITRIDTLLHITCLTHYDMDCDTVWQTQIIQDTVIRIFYDSIVVHSDTLFDIGRNIPQPFVAMLDTMDIVMNVWTASGCHHIDTFRVIRLPVPREFIGDTTVAHGDTLQLFAHGLEDNTMQWWTELRANRYYLNVAGSDLIPDNKPGFGMGHYDSVSRFIGDTTPLVQRPPGTFRLDSIVDMVLHSVRTFPEHDDRVCHVRDTVGISVVSGFRIAGFVSYDTFWLPGATIDLHRPIANVTVLLYELGSLTPIDTAISDATGHFEFTTRHRPGRYVLMGESPQKGMDAGALAGVSSTDAALVEAWAVGGAIRPYIGAGDVQEKRTMMYVAANVREELRDSSIFTGIPHDFVNLSSSNAAHIQNRIVGLLNPNRYSRDPIRTADLVVLVPDWKYSIDTIDLFENITDFHMLGVIVGDANLDYTPNIYCNTVPGGLRTNNIVRVDDDGWLIDMTTGARVTGDGIDWLQDRCYGNVICPFPTPVAVGPMSAPATKSGRATAPPQPVRTNFDVADTIFVNSADQFINVPIIATTNGSLRSFQIFLNFPAQDVEVLSVHTPARARLVHNIVGDRVALSWVASEPQAFREGDVVASLVVKINRSRSLRGLTTRFQMETHNFQAGGVDFRTDRNFRIALPAIVIDNTIPVTILDSLLIFPPETQIDTVVETAVESLQVSPAPDIQSSKILNVIPNPIVDQRADVTYSVADDAIVTIRLLNLLGVEVRTLVDSERQEMGVYRQRLSVDGLPNGVYVLRMEAVSRGNREFSVEKVVINR